MPAQDWNDHVKALLVAEIDSSPLDNDDTMRIVARLALVRADLNFENRKTDHTWLRRTRIQVRCVDPLTGRPAVRFEDRHYSHDERIGMVGVTLGSILVKRERKTRKWVLRAIEEIIISDQLRKELNEAARRKGWPPERRRASNG